ncbi:hypothetical protein TNCT_347551 [Trichonephila clavata]|uniref:Uncharacterized protein n=1 Tax=Trichonephila clavata TaxID=2740835 RepID=A0A8X6F4G1_TRICU|nr:hypothetical protein TNCT_347551 [Trichonephila clavata]
MESSRPRAAQSEDLESTRPGTEQTQMFESSQPRATQAEGYNSHRGSAQTEFEGSICVSREMHNRGEGRREKLRRPESTGSPSTNTNHNRKSRPIARQMDR